MVRKKYVTNLSKIKDYLIIQNLKQKKDHWIQIIILNIYKTLMLGAVNQRNMLQRKFFHINIVDFLETKDDIKHIKIHKFFAD